MSGSAGSESVDDTLQPKVEATAPARGGAESSRARGTHLGGEHFRHTRTSAAWVGIVVAVIFGVALIDFIAQNTRSVHIHFFSVSGQMPVAVALLAAALSAAILVTAVGVGRVAQLRLTMRRQRRPGLNSRVEADDQS